VDVDQSPVGNWDGESSYAFGPLTVPAALSTFSFDVNSVTEMLTTHTYQELAFSGPTTMIL